VTIPGTKIDLDLEKGTVSYLSAEDELLAGPFHFKSLGAVTQELIVLGGLEEWVKQQLM
jgi:hypothetical protein